MKPIKTVPHVCCLVFVLSTGSLLGMLEQPDQQSLFQLSPNKSCARELKNFPKIPFIVECIHNKNDKDGEMYLYGYALVGTQVISLRKKLFAKNFEVIGTTQEEADAIEQKHTKLLDAMQDTIEKIQSYNRLWPKKPKLFSRTEKIRPPIHVPTTALPAVVVTQEPLHKTGDVHL